LNETGSRSITRVRGPAIGARSAATAECAGDANMSKRLAASQVWR
jgi:hypothetical protein